MIIQSLFFFFFFFLFLFNFFPILLLLLDNSKYYIQEELEKRTKEKNRKKCLRLLFVYYIKCITLKPVNNKKERVRGVVMMMNLLLVNPRISYLINSCNSISILLRVRT